MDYQLIADKIRELRIKKNITQEKLAELVGVSTVFISAMEHNRKHASLPTLIKKLYSQAKNMI